MNECKPLVQGEDDGAEEVLREAQHGVRGGGLHSFPFPLNFSLPCSFPLN